MKLKLIFVIILGISTLTTCQKAREKRWCKNPIKIPQRVVDYFYFKEGTYWIYENETTQELDSQWVTSSRFKYEQRPGDLDTDEKHCNCYNKLCFEWFDIYIKSNKLNSYGYGVNADLNHVDQFTKSNYTYYFELNVPYLVTTYLMIDNNDTWKCSVNMTDTLSLQIANINYTNNISFYDINYMNGKRKSDIFYKITRSKNIGIISYTDYDRQNWKLIRKHIIQ